MEWFYSQRAYPFATIPAGARLNAIRNMEKAERVRRQQRPMPAFDSASWTSIGPAPVDPGTTSTASGRINAIAIDPRDSNVVYLGAAEGGVWKTTDGGLNWKALTDDQPSLATGAIALDPQNPDTVYVGTGELNNSADSYYGAGILKSADGGATWANIVGPFLRDRIGSLLVHPKSSQTVFAASGFGVWRSDDGGASWKSVLAGGAASALQIDPVNPDTMYAALGAFRGSTKNGVYKSTDGGNTWALSMGSGANSLPSADVGRIDLALAPSSPNILYAAIQNAATKNFGNFLGMYKSTDGGATWNQLPKATSDFCALQCWYDMTVRVHPKDPDNVWFGGFQIVRSLDGGATWTRLPQAGPNGNYLHVDEHFLAFTNDGAKLFISNDGGIYSTTDITKPSGINWTELNDTLGLSQFYPGMSIHPSDPTIGFGGTQDNHVQRFNGKPGWQSVTCGDGGHTVINAASPKTALAACQNIQILYSDSGGDSWFSAQHGIATDDPVQFIAPLRGDPTVPGTIYFGTYRVWRSTDNGGKWTAISEDLSGNKLTIKAIAIAPSDSNVVYVATSNARVQLTTNARSASGVTFNNVSTGLPFRTPTQIAVDPFDAATAYVTYSGFSSSATKLPHVFKTTNGGASWQDASGDLPDLPVNDIAIDPDLPSTIYLGTDSGVMFTTNGGTNWSQLGSGIPRAVVFSLVLHRASRTLRAGTHGRGAWDINLPLASPSAQPAITALSPTSANAGGGDFTLSVTGNNFIPGTTLRWNGSDRPTKFIDSTHLEVSIPASDIATVGQATVLAFASARGAGPSVPVRFPIGPAPSSTSNAFVNAAYPAGGNALAQRSIASLYGVNLAAGTVIADGAPPLPFQLGGVTLTMASGNVTDQIVPVFFVSPGQINFQVPNFGYTKPTPAKLTIQQGTLSTTVDITLKAYSPGLFTTNSQGTGQAAAVIAGTGTVVAPAGAYPDSRPAMKGDYISFYGTGLGDVSNRPGLGAPSPSAPLAYTLATPSVSIGGIDSKVLFSGLAPGFVGLYQINVQVPDTAPAGAAVPVILKIGGETSNTVTVALQ